MARSCSVCRDPRVEKINIACLEGTGTQQIAQDYGISRAMIDNHRQSGHAGKALTRMVLDASKGPLSELHQFFISSKANRISRLDEYLQRIDNALKDAEAEKRPPDSKLLKVGVEILRVAAQELGEWRPDGGEKAEATLKLAQSIVIHAAVDAAKASPALRTIDVSHNNDE